MEGVLIGAVAQSVLSAVINPLVEKICNAKKKKFLEKEIEDLEKLLERLTGYLQDAEQKQSKNESVRLWLAEMEDIVYDAEDLMDEYVVNVECMKTEKEPTTEVSSFRHSFRIAKKYVKEPFTQIKYKKRFNDITTRLDKIMMEHMKLGLQAPAPAPFHITSSFQRPETVSFIDDEISIYGRSEMRNNIVNRLLSVNNDEISFTVLPVIGMGGIGKTTVAKLVYNDKLIQDHFHVRIWVCVSNEFNVDSLRKEIMQLGLQSGGNKENCDTSNLNALQIKFRDHMKDKRYFLVLDDAWNEDRNLWDHLLESLNVGTKSRIMVTTRSSKVAGAIYNSMEPITLTGLSDDETWMVFKKYAFKNFDSINSAQYYEFESIGKQISRKLKGSPLAARSIGSLLNSTMNLEYWRSTLENDLWADVKDTIFPILMLSYQNLHPILKRCFAYCSLFPEDFKFNEQELVDLWIAEGYMQDESGMGIEDLGKKCMYEMKERSFFQPSNSDYVMHDLLHELARSVSSEIYTWIHNGRFRKVKKFGRVRHMLIHGYNNTHNTLMNACKFEKLRTLMIPYVDSLYAPTLVTEVVLESWFTKLKYLHVLKLQGCRITKIIDSIGNLKHLRYLDLSLNSIEKIPTIIGDLNLVCHIDLSNNYIQEVPTSIGNLKLLRYLDLSYNSIKQVPTIIGDLNLLRHMDVRVNKIQQVPTSIGNLQLLRYLDLSHNNIEKIPTTIGDLNFLHYIKLSGNKIQEVPTSIGNLKLLRYLHLSRNSIEQVPTIIGDLNLVCHIDLYRNKIREIPTSIGNLKLLRYLDVSDNNIEQVPTTIGLCCKLEVLNLNGCRKLQKLPDSISDLVHMKHLKVNSDFVSTLKGIGKLSSLQELKKFCVSTKVGR